MTDYIKALETASANLTSLREKENGKNLSQIIGKNKVPLIDLKISVVEE